MIERIVDQNGEKVIEVRSEGGKLLYKKTKAGYEMKCPRTKKTCVISYDQMLFDCLKCFADNDDETLLRSKSQKIRELLNTV